MMTEWTPDASEYLEGYLKQVAALARNQGDDAEEIVSGLRDHLTHEVGSTTGVPVTIDTLFEVLAAIGTPEQVASSETPLGSLSQPAAPPPLPPSSAPSPQQVIVKPRSWLGCSVASLIFLVVAILLVKFVATIGAIFMSSHLQAREGAHRASCANNQKQIGIVLKMWANEHDGAFPSLSDQSGRLMISLDIYPNYVSDGSKFVCPADEIAPATVLDRDLIDDYSYYYLGHAIANEEEGLAYVQAYRVAALAGDGFDHDFVLEDGATLRRVSTKLHGQSAHEIPVLIEKPHHHKPTGGNVLYLDGHVEFMVMGSGFPMTEEFLSALDSIDE